MSQSLLLNPQSSFTSQPILYLPDRQYFTIYINRETPAYKELFGKQSCEWYHVIQYIQSCKEQTPCYELEVWSVQLRGSEKRHVTILKIKVGLDLFSQLVLPIAWNYFSFQYGDMVLFLAMQYDTFSRKNYTFVCDKGLKISIPPVL